MSVSVIFRVRWVGVLPSFLKIDVRKARRKGLSAPQNKFFTPCITISEPQMDAETAHIDPGSPRETGYCEAFSVRLRDELLNGGIFYILKETQVVIEHWRNHYNTNRRHSAPGYCPRAFEMVDSVSGLRREPYIFFI